MKNKLLQLLFLCLFLTGLGCEKLKCYECTTTITTYYVSCNQPTKVSTVTKILCDVSAPLDEYYKEPTTKEPDSTMTIYTTLSTICKEK